MEIENERTANIQQILDVGIGHGCKACYLSNIFWIRPSGTIKFSYETRCRKAFSLIFCFFMFDLNKKKILGNVLCKGFCWSVIYC